jgi:hypothetical protein
MRLRGKVRLKEGPLAFRRTTLVEGKERIATLDEGELEIELEDGGVVSVEAPAEGLVLVRSPKPSVVSGPWSELRERPEASGFKRNAVAPFSAVELHAISLEADEAVEVYAAVFEWAFDDAASFREGATKRPSRAVAKMMAFREPREDLMRAMTLAIAEANRVPPVAPPMPVVREDEPEDPWGPQKPAAWVPLGGTLGTAVLCLVAGTLSASRAGMWRYELFAAQWAALAISLRPWPEVPEFRSRGKSIRDKSGWAFGVRLLLGSTPLAVMTWAWGAETLSVAASLTVAVVFLVGWTVAELLWNGRDHRVLSTLVSSRRLSPFDEPGRAGTCVAEVIDTNPVKVGGRKAAMGLVTHFSKGTGDEADTAEGSSFSARRTFLVEAEGRTIEIDPDECLWATTVKRAPDDPGGSYDVAEWVPIDGKVAIYGQYVDQKRSHGPPAIRLLAIGARPAVLFATSAGGDPLRRAARVVWHRRVTLAGLAAILGAVATLALLRPA